MDTADIGEARVAALDKHLHAVTPLLTYVHNRLATKVSSGRPSASAWSGLMSQLMCSQLTMTQIEHHQRLSLSGLVCGVFSTQDLFRKCSSAANKLRHLMLCTPRMSIRTH